MQQIFSRAIYFILCVVLLITYSCQKGHERLPPPGVDPAGQYINFSGGGTTINFTPPTDSFMTGSQGTTINIHGFRAVWTDSASYQYTSFNFTGVTAPGTYTLNSGTFIITKGFNLEYHDNAPITITITEFGGTGQYIAGSFSGPMREFYTSSTTTGSCNFRVRRGL